MTMASVTVNQGNPGNSSAMITPKRYHHSQSGTNSSPASSSTTSVKDHDSVSKEKKSWSVRLGLSKQNQTNNITNDLPKRCGWGTISGGSALSRQMRYGDPWLYGTVRCNRKENHHRYANSISSSSPQHHQQHHHHHHHQPQQGLIIRPSSSSPTSSSSLSQVVKTGKVTPILVVCSCPEFLNGTTRKLGNCKKCGGHRLAGVSLGGGTCRLQETSSRLRPSIAGILRPGHLMNDPYDLVRRSRLVEPRSPQTTPTPPPLPPPPTRARSVSPSRKFNQRDARSQSVVIVNNYQRSSEWFGNSNNNNNNNNNNSNSNSNGISNGGNCNSDGDKNDEWLDDENYYLNDKNNKNINRRTSNNNNNNNNNNSSNKNKNKNNNENKRDCFNDQRKSILECDVNPYLLVKKQQRDENNELRKDIDKVNEDVNDVDHDEDDEDDDDDDFSDDLSDNALEFDDHLPTLFDSSKVKSIDRIPARFSVAAIGGQRIRVFNETRDVATKDKDCEFVNDKRCKFNEMNGYRDCENDDDEDDDLNDDDDEDDYDDYGGDKILTKNNPISSIPVAKLLPKRPPRKQKIEFNNRNKVNVVPVKSILKKLKFNKNFTAVKKSVVFKIDDVIFSPTKTDFDLIGMAGQRRARVCSSSEFVNKDYFDSVNYEEGVRKKIDESNVVVEGERSFSTVSKVSDKVPKFITIPNIKDLKRGDRVCNNNSNADKTKGSSSSSSNVRRNDKAFDPVQRTSGIPRSINVRTESVAATTIARKTATKSKIVESTSKPVDIVEKKIVEEPKIIGEDETALEIEIVELCDDEKTDGDRPEQRERQFLEDKDIVKRSVPNLQRSQSERMCHGNFEIVDNICFNDTMRLSVKKLQRNTKDCGNVDKPNSVDCFESIDNECKIEDEVPSKVDDTRIDDRQCGNVNIVNVDKNKKDTEIENQEHFRCMRPTSLSPPPSIRYKKNPEHRNGDSEAVESNNMISSINKSDNVFKISVNTSQSTLVHRLKVGSSELMKSYKTEGKKTSSIMINGDENLNNDNCFDNKVTISVGGEDSVCNPTVISVNTDILPNIKNSKENRTLVILDNYSSNIIVEPAVNNDGKLSKENQSNGSYESLKSYGVENREDKPNKEEEDEQEQEDEDRQRCRLRRRSRDVRDNLNDSNDLTEESVVSRIIEDSFKKAKRNGEILDESSGEAILKILKKTLLKSENCSIDRKADDTGVGKVGENYSTGSVDDSAGGDFVPGNMYVEENSYEVIKEPIYEEIPDEPPPLPLSSPPLDNNYNKGEIYYTDEYKPDYYKKFDSGKYLRSYFQDDFANKTTNDDSLNLKIRPNGEDEKIIGEKKYGPDDEYSKKFKLLNYLIDSKDQTSLVVEGEEDEEEDDDDDEDDADEEEDEEGEIEALYEQKETSLDDLSSKSSQISNVSDSSEEGNLNLATSSSPEILKIRTVDIERTDSGVGSESSQTSSSRGATRRWRGNNNAASSSSSGTGSVIGGIPQLVSGDIKLCHDCEQRLDPLVTISGVVYAPFVCRKCAKKRSERKEIIMEIVETEEKYGRDLQIILEEFYRPMLRAGLLTQDQLSAIFLNVEELLEHNVTLADKLRDALDFSQENGDEDLVKMDVGKIFLESEGMLHAFESYCTRQGGASLLLQNLEKEKELLRIFLKVSQMENTVLRRMNLNSFLMVPVQRVTKYPLLLARLFKATPSARNDIQLAKTKLKQAQTNIELHLEHMNAEAKDVTSTRLWRRISIIQNGRRSMGEQDMVNIKLRKMAVEILEWAHEEVRFALEGRLLVALPTDNNWRRGKTVKLVPVTAMLVTNGKPNTQFLDLNDDSLFPRQIGIKEATLLLVKEKIGRYSLLREPLYLDKCIVCCEADLEDYFEIQELSSKETFIFKAEDGARTKRWCRTLQAHAQSLGAWRRRRGALANIMICGVARN